jgi:hypothetical protein
MIDASGLLLGDEGITLDNSRQAALPMETAPDNPTTGSTVLLNLWQRNMLALRAERRLRLRWVGSMRSRLSAALTIEGGG